MALYYWLSSNTKSVHCTLYFSNNPTEKKSGAVRSGERGGHGISPKREITRSNANHSRVGRSTILLKPQDTTVWWKIRGQKFIDHLCVTLRRDWVRADRLGLRLTAASNRAMFSGVRTDDCRPGGYLHVTEPSRHCQTHRWIAFGDGASW
jgi:hypothetical protein